MDESGACSAIAALTDIVVKATEASCQTGPSAAEQKRNLLSDMFNQINSPSNAFSLDTTVNNAKLFVVKAGLKEGAACAASPEPVLLEAVNAYFDDPSINGPTRALATTLDGLANTAVNNAVINAQAAIARIPGGKRQAAKKIVFEAAVKKAQAFYKNQHQIQQSWDMVLACATHLAHEP